VTVYSGLLGKRRSVSGASVDPAQSRMVLGGGEKANCTGCRHCMVKVGYGAAEPVLSRQYLCMADDPPRLVGHWLTVRPDWCPVADRGDGRVDAAVDAIAGGQGREPAETTAAADALQIAGLVGFMVFVCWCLTSCGDIGRLVR
jgi:hypothetical protein